MNMQNRLLLVAGVSMGLIGVAVVVADRAEPRTVSSAAVTQAAASARSTRPSTARALAQHPSERRDEAPNQPNHGAIEALEPERVETRLTAEWDVMSSEQRADETGVEFRRSLRLAQDRRSRTELEHAATMLSVLRAELYATDSGRQEFERLEAEYDAVELELDSP